MHPLHNFDTLTGKSSNEEHFAPVAMGAVALAPKVLPLFKKVGGLAKSISNIRYRDNVFARVRDEITTTFQQAGIPDSILNQAIDSNDVRKVKSWKLGKNYNEEFSRLYNYVVSTFKLAGMEDKAQQFQQAVDVYDDKFHPVEPIKLLLSGAKLGTMNAQGVNLPSSPGGSASDITNATSANTGIGGGQSGKPSILTAGIDGGNMKTILIVGLVVLVIYIFYTTTQK